MGEVTWPLEQNMIRGQKVSNTFGMVRTYANGTPKPHQGWDFAAAVGTPAYAIADGKIEFIADNPQTLLKKQPIGAGTHFEHISARAVGDINALSPEKKQLTERKPLPFPEDIRMILDCTEALKNAIREAVQANRGLLR